MDYKQNIIAMLNLAYIYENKAFRGYMYSAVTVTGPLHDVYEDLYKKFSDREKEHIYEIGEKITALGGKVSTKVLPIDDIENAISKGYDEVLTVLQTAETKSLEIYKKIHKLCTENDDLPTALLIEHIMQEEQEHHDELERILLDVSSNTEKHDILEVDAFYNRKIKLFKLFQ